MRECRSCAARGDEAAFPAEHKRGTPMLCVDCEAERARLPMGSKQWTITRASYRAALRHRRCSPQLDLVDLIVMAP